MSLLTFSTLDTVGALGVGVSVRPCTVGGVPVTVYLGDDPITAREVKVSDGTTGVVVFDLTPNADLEPEGSGYLVEIPTQGFSAIIVKGSGSETLLDCLVDTLDPLVPLEPGGGASDATELTYTPADGSDWSPVPDDAAEALDQLAARPTGGGGGGAVDSVNGQTGVVVLDADDVGAASRAFAVAMGVAL